MIPAKVVNIVIKYQSYLRLPQSAVPITPTIQAENFFKNGCENEMVLLKLCL